MKTLLLVILSIIILFGQNYSQDFKLSMYYLDGEKSKDSHSTEETFTINGYDVSYYVKYSGYRSKKQIDANKTCTFTERDITNIKYAITKQGLNTNGTVTDESSKYKSYEVYCNISLDITMDGSDYKIRVNGDVDEIKKNDLYKNSVYLASLLRKLVKNCQ